MLDLKHPELKKMTSVILSKEAVSTVSKKRGRKPNSARASQEVRTSIPTIPEDSVPQFSAEITVSENTIDTDSKNTRTPVTKESVNQEFLDIIHALNTEITQTRDTDKKSAKFLRTLVKQLKVLCSHTLKICKHRKKRINGNSGFSKPVRISAELAKFTGWSPTELKARTDVTRFMCEYIKKHSLANPSDRRIILVQNDEKLRKLLKYSEADGPVNYGNLQRYLAKHFPKEN